MEEDEDETKSFSKTSLQMLRWSFSAAVRSRNAILHSKLWVSV
jgi:hypothetical protein